MHSETITRYRRLDTDVNVRSCILFANARSVEPAKKTRFYFDHGRDYQENYLTDEDLVLLKTKRKANPHHTIVIRAKTERLSQTTEDIPPEENEQR
jgi:hypothetical protein